MKLTKEEMEALFDLVFLGNWLVNSIRLEDMEIEKYQRLAEKVEKLHQKIVPSEVMERYLNMWDFYFSRLEKFIDEYDDEGCFPKLAEKLAKAKFPDDFSKQIDAQNFFEKQLREKGISVVKLKVTCGKH